jgi:hypothetical protein
MARALPGAGIRPNANARIDETERERLLRLARTEQPAMHNVSEQNGNITTLSISALAAMCIGTASEQQDDTGCACQAHVMEMTGKGSAAMRAMPNG